jgi:hypothetical protein
MKNHECPLFVIEKRCRGPMVYFMVSDDKANLRCSMHFYLLHDDFIEGAKIISKEDYEALTIISQ